MGWESGALNPCHQSRNFGWGDEEPTAKQANFEHNVGKTSEVGSYPPNPWGLRDMERQRVGVGRGLLERDESYQGAPSDGSAWTSGDCSRRVLRGGSWFDPPEDVRSANRFWLDIDTGWKNDIIGFRVARTLR